jgi:hypothetical protein
MDQVVSRRPPASHRGGPGSIPGSVHVGYVVDKVALGQVFPPSTSVSPCRFHSTGAPLLGKGQKILIIVTFITGLHKKPQGCGTSVASAAGPFTTKKKNCGRSNVGSTLTWKLEVPGGVSAVAVGFCDQRITF